MLDWLIIGGGVIGTALSNYMVNAYGVPADKLRVLDPHAEPLARWNHFTANTGMQYLRSPQVHHLATEHLSLQHYMDAHPELGGFIRPFRRPAYRVFQAHTAATIERAKLADLRVQGSAEFIMTTKGGLRVETSNGVIKAKRVLLAIGRTALNLPVWARDLQAAGAPVQHVFSWGFRLNATPTDGHTVVVGGGITAGQVALALSGRAPGRVTLLMRHPVAEADFDSSPCWVGPSCRKVFVNATSLTSKRNLIAQARNRGTMSQDVVKRLRAAITDGTLHRVQGDVVSVAAADDGVVLRLAAGEAVRASRVLLATGFDGARPGGAWLDEVIGWFDLPLAPCGYPVVDGALHWGQGIYVSGPLAELEVGPPAGNIVGARMAAERIRRAV